MVRNGHLPWGRMRDDGSLPVKKGQGGSKPTKKTHNSSLCRKKKTLSEKKTLIDLLGLVCKLGYLLFVPKKK